MIIETYVHDAAAHRDHRAEIRWADFIVHVSFLTVS
jgi:hypothetical protein